ncbi:hypothetical protein [Psychromonas arctica]|uniref:hypothetical protein n=1 Tax=Psychromonas arctica TaxID=168275 RepID=UPI002FD1CEDB
MRGKIYNVIQTFVSGERDQNLYYFSKGSVYFEKHAIKFSYLSLIDSHTYFNTLPLAKIRKHTDINQLMLKVNGNGKFLISINTANKSGSVVNLFKTVLLLSGEHILNFSDDCQNIFDERLLSVSIQCLSDKGSIEKMEWVTDISPANEVKLAIVITHYKREKAVELALDKITVELSKAGIDIIVVDNSQSLELPEYPSTFILKNENLGGSGGFTRGMLFAKDADYSHVILMDDDASCEVESIFRTRMLFQYSTQDKLAVSGALLDEEYSYSVWENGAKFNGICKPLMHKLDLRNPRNVSIIANSSDVIDYGGWWYFGFKLSEIKYFSFPFFVRGDDIMFSMVNDFELITYAGICSWGDSFSNKTSPITAYLDSRHHIVQLLTHLDLGKSRLNIILIKQMLICLLSYKYSSAKALLFAMEHILIGRSFWADNVDMINVRKDIALLPDEQMTSNNLISNPKELFLDDESEPLRVEPLKIEAIHRSLMRLITLNGNLVPGFMLSNDISYQNHERGIKLKSVFMKKSICYVNRQGFSYAVSRNNIEAIKIISIFTIRLIKININYKYLRKEYSEAFNTFTREKFWEKIFKVKK